MLVSPLPPSFLGTYSLSTYSLGCNALCMVISFRVLWSICLSSLQVHFKDDPEYLTRETAQVFIPLIRFLLYSFISSSFLVLLKYSFFIFSHLLLFDGFFFFHLILIDYYYYYYYYYLLLESFSHHCYLIVFHRSLSDSKSPQVSRTLLTILAVLNNAVVWMVSTSPPTPKSPSPVNSPLVTVPNAPITNGISVTFMFHSFFNFLARSRYLSFFSLSFNFTLWSAGTAKSTILQVLFFLFFFFFFFCLLACLVHLTWIVLNIKL